MTSDLTRVRALIWYSTRCKRSARPLRWSRLKRVDLDGWRLGYLIFGLVRRLPRFAGEEQKRGVGILVAMATVGSLFIVVLGTGFRVANDRANPIGDALYYGAIVVLALVVVGVVRNGWVGNVIPSLRGGRLSLIDRMPPNAQPDAVETPTQTDETSARFTELHRRIQALARVLDAPGYYLPTFRIPEGDGRPYVEIEGDTYHYVTSERGVEHERDTTRSLDDLLYAIFRDVAFSMAVRLASAHRKPGEDFRREMFRQQLGLLRRLNPDWEARTHLEHLETLVQHPFIDER